MPYEYLICEQLIEFPINFSTKNLRIRSSSGTTNILVYGFLENDIERHNVAVRLLFGIIDREVFISTQVISELYSALIKNRVEHDKITKYIGELEENMNICAVALNTVKTCLQLKKRYLYSYWDSLILASALENSCTIVYSEDMQHQQVIEKSLTIVNAFVS